VNTEVSICLARERTKPRERVETKHSAAYIDICEPVSSNESGQDSRREPTTSTNTLSPLVSNLPPNLPDLQSSLLETAHTLTFFSSKLDVEQKHLLPLDPYGKLQPLLS